MNTELKFVLLRIECHLKYIAATELGNESIRQFNKWKAELEKIEAEFIGEATK